MSAPCPRHSVGLFRFLMPPVTAAHYSFIVVGCGPVGAVAALLLAASHRSILVIESSTEVYPLPRAVHIDAHSARLLASILPASTFASLISPMQHCTFEDAQSRQLLHFACRQHSSHGLHGDFLIDQPELERALRSRLVDHSNLTFIQADTVIDVQERSGSEQPHVHVTTASGRRFSADWVLACDGARSAVRSLLHIPMLSLASASALTSTHWWVVDGLMSAAAKREHGLTEYGVTQVCDEERPITVLNLPGDRLRVEVRRQEVDGPQHQQAAHIPIRHGWQRMWNGLCYLLLVAWSSIAPLVSSSWSAWKVEAVAASSAPTAPCIVNEDSSPPLRSLLPRCVPVSAFTLVRCAAYTMHSLIAASFLSPSHRIVLLGDAAHLSPPYLGQALCLGIRDAASLAFHLALSSPCEPCNLTEWEAERRGEAAEITVRSGKVGRLLEIRGTWQCWLRDAVMRAVDSSVWIKAAFQADVAVYGQVLYAGGRRKLILWPQIDDSDVVLLRGGAVSIIGVDCDAQQLVQVDKKTLDGNSSELLLHFTRIDARTGVSGPRWRSWLTSVGLRGAGVAVVRPDRYLLGIYALDQQRLCYRYLRAALSCAPCAVLYCEGLPFPIFDHMRGVRG